MSPVFSLMPLTTGIRTSPQSPPSPGPFPIMPPLVQTCPATFEHPSMYFKRSDRHMLAHTCSHMCLHLSPLSFLGRVLLYIPGWSGIHDSLALASWVLVCLACATTPGSHLIHSHVITCVFALTLALTVSYYHHVPQV